MPLLVVHLPDGPPAHLALGDGDVVLVGREPVLTGVAVSPAAPVPTRRLVVASPLVSSAHAVVWRDATGVRVHDLASKNGTHLRLDRGVTTTAGVDEVHLILAAARTAVHASAPLPVAAADVSPDEFAARLARAVTEWLAQAGVRPGVTVVRDDGAERLDEGRFRIPLTDGLALELTDPEGERTQIRWDAHKATLFPYAYEQIAAYRACRDARLLRPLVFRAPQAERALREVLDAARARLPLVLTGESGTGKTELAAVYGGREAQRPGRAGDPEGPPFVTVHCAHLEPALAHSLLFGALKGSFTSAHRTIVGAVKLADRGTLFLYDVDALPPETQTKLLRFLDRGEYEPLGHGERAPLVASVRVVAGTNADLRAAVRERRFREDLYWRLHSGVVVRVPPLRDRPEDIELVLRRAHADPARGEPGDGDRPPPAPGASVHDRLDSKAVDFLVHRHPWRGNFRECLRFCARVAMRPPGGPRLDRRDCEAILAEATLDEAAVAAPEQPPPTDDGAFARAIEQAVAWWMASESAPPVRFDELGRFCDDYLKSAFVAHALGLAEAAARPDSFDRKKRQQLGCDLSTLKRKIDDYLALRDAPRDGERAR